MFNCKHTCNCIKKVDNETLVFWLERLARKYETEWLEDSLKTFKKNFNALLNYLNLEVVPDNEKEKIPDIQFRKRKHTKQAKQ